MRITVKTMQDRNTKESRYMKKFQKNIRKVLLKTYSQKGMNDEYINEIINGLATFDPVLDWKYKPICGCEVAGFDEVKHNLKQDRLFERNGHLLYGSIESTFSKIGSVTEGYEMWVLEDMRIVFTYFIEMSVDCKSEEERMIYRYALGNRVPEDMDMPLDDVLDELESAAFNARGCP